MSRISTVDRWTPLESLTTPGRGDVTAARLQQHLDATVKRLRKLGVHPGDCVASLLPEGPDAVTASMAVADIPHAKFASLDPRGQYDFLLQKIHPKLLLLHPGEHPARQAAFKLGIPVVNVLRHFEAGVFTLEAALGSEAPLPSPKWKSRGVPLVLIAPGLAYRRLANRLDATNPVIGITPPSLELMTLPRTIEHVAAECVRMLRRCRPRGPYALAGLQAEGLVALEMARLLEEEGEKIEFVALLDASSLFVPSLSPIRRALVSIRGLFVKEGAPSCELAAEALRQYRPHPWYGKILHIHSSGEPTARRARFKWRDVAPQGFASFEAPGEQTVAEILASELNHARRKTNPRASLLF